MGKSILTRTKAVLGKKMMEKLASLRFCIVGCGGTGATFAEMLVRSGVKNICLVDGDKVDETNLNRVFGFVSENVGENKVNILKERLESIGPEINVCSFTDYLRSREHTTPGNHQGQKVRDCVYDADAIFIGTDTNESRIVCEELCKDKSGGKIYLSCGIGVEKEKSFFECNWKPETPIKKQKGTGYGPENASYISIVTEATSVAFSMLLYHLKKPQSDKYKKYYKEYDKDFIPLKCQLD